MRFNSTELAALAYSDAIRGLISGLVLAPVQIVPSTRAAAGISSGAIAGIVVGAVGVVAGAALGLLKIRRARTVRETQGGDDYISMNSHYMETS
jgi:hypothetical protein